MRPNMRVFILLAVFLLLANSSDALTRKQKALVGLKGMDVLVEDIGPEAKRLGLTPEQIKTDVELRLRKAGVRVLTAEESYEIPGSPGLYVNVNTLLGTGPFSGAFSVAVIVELDEIVTLANGIITTGAIWQKGGVTTVGINRITDIRSDVGDLVDEFINDYLAANAK